jgi:hypothetical protein
MDLKVRKTPFDFSANSSEQILRIGPLFIYFGSISFTSILFLPLHVSRHWSFIIGFLEQ